jgi:L-threonylcarbamoyladenylate synthase
MAQARALARIWPAAAGELAARFWPGPLTLVVPAAPGLAEEIVGPGGGVGVRVSSHAVPVALARALGRPITATSANPGGKPPAMDVARARAYFGDRVIYLDSGPAPGERPSTVVAIAGDGTTRVLRPGPVDMMVKPGGNH